MVSGAAGWQLDRMSLVHGRSAQTSCARLRRNLLAVATVVLLGSQPNDCAAVSFDCSKAQSFREKSVCSNDELGKLDDDLNAAYRAAQAVSSDPQSLRELQRNWMSEANRCADEGCLTKAYRERIEQLNGSHAEAGTLDSSQRNDQEKPTDEPTASNGLKVQTVVADGIGKDPQDAAQNAAQNALTNVVGSFLDSDTFIGKRTEIAEGIRTQTKDIVRQDREYSQGTIQRIELLTTENLGQLFKVTAKVTVRIDDFKAYIKKLAEGETAVGGGLFAQMATQKKQKENLVELIGDIINPIVAGQVVEFKVSPPQPTSQPNVVEFDVTASLNRDFVSNAEKKLAATALKKLRIGADSIRGPVTGEVMPDDEDLNAFELASFDDEDRQLARFALQQESGRAYDGYVFAFPWDQMGDRIVPWFANNCRESSVTGFPNLEIDILGANAAPLQTEFVSNRSASAAVLDSNSAFGARADEEHGNSASVVAGEGFVPYVPIGCPPAFGHIFLVIKREVAFKIRLHVNDDVLKQAQKIVLKLVQ